MKTIFCRRLKELRLEKNLRQLDVAKVMYVACNTISNWERGRNSPSLEELGVLARFFEVPADYLLGLVDIY